MKLSILSLVLALSVTGCIPMIIMNSQDHDHYSQYVITTNQLNTDREKNHLAPLHVMTFDEWKGETKNPSPPAK